MGGSVVPHTEGQCRRSGDGCAHPAAQDRGVRLPGALLLLTVAASAALQASEGRLLAELRIDEGTISISSDGVPADGADALVGWARAAAEAVGGYYGRFPVPHLQLRIAIGRGDAVSGGREFDGDLIRISVGRGSTAATFADDWRLTHEMTHLAFPDLDERHLWMEEGLATYLEPIARCRAGQLPAERVWRDLVEGLPQGLPQRGDRGLDRTPTWGRTYWGGALFWLLADIGIRERSDGKKSLRDALLAILDAGGNNGQHWDIQRVIAVGDAATGAPVLDGLYRRLALAPGKEDLDALWKKLGVVYADRHASFDAHAPEAAIRAAITAP
jgi:hypothetical protein